MRKKRGAKADYKIYDRKLDETIDKCLTCTKAKCTGECQLIRKGYSQTNKIYIVEASRTIANGTIKKSYVTAVTTNNFVQRITDPAKARPRTYAGAKWLMIKARKFLKDTTDLKIIQVKDAM